MTPKEAQIIAKTVGLIGEAIALLGVLVGEAAQVSPTACQHPQERIVSYARMGHPHEYLCTLCEAILPHEPTKEELP